MRRPYCQIIMTLPILIPKSFERRHRRRFRCHERENHKILPMATRATLNKLFPLNFHMVAVAIHELFSGPYLLTLQNNPEKIQKSHSMKHQITVAFQIVPQSSEPQPNSQQVGQKSIPFYSNRIVDVKHWRNLCRNSQNSLENPRMDYSSSSTQSYSNVERTEPKLSYFEGSTESTITVLSREIQYLMLHLTFQVLREKVLSHMRLRQKSFVGISEARDKKKSIDGAEPYFHPSYRSPQGST